MEEREQEKGQKRQRQRENQGGKERIRADVMLAGKIVLRFVFSSFSFYITAKLL